MFPPLALSPPLPVLHFSMFPLESIYINANSQTSKNKKFENKNYMYKIKTSQVSKRLKCKPRQFFTCYQLDLELFSASLLPCPQDPRITYPLAWKASPMEHKTYNPDWNWSFANNYHL